MKPEEDGLKDQQHREHKQICSHRSLCWGSVLVVFVTGFLLGSNKHVVSKHLITLPLNFVSKNHWSSSFNPNHKIVPNFILTPKFVNGSLVLMKNILNGWNQPLQKWKPQGEFLTSIHIAKSGGTYFDECLRKSGLNELGISAVTKMVKKNLPHPKLFNGYGFGFYDFHFDFSLVSELERHGYHSAPITILRHPVDRMVSNFHWDKRVEKWTNHLNISKQNLSEYLEDRASMVVTYEIWYDGQVS